MLRRALLGSAALWVAFAGSAPAFLLHGGLSAAADAIHVVTSNGQDFVYLDTSVYGTSPQTTDRFSLYVSSSPITSGTFGSAIGGATLVNSILPPNSGQLLGGNPDAAGGTALTLAHQIDNTLPMAKIPSIGSLPFATPLGVNTRTTSGGLYYALGKNSDTVQPGVNATKTPVSAATSTPQPYLWAAGAARTGGGTHAPIASAAPLGIYFPPAPNIAVAGAAANCQDGDYWQLSGDTTMGWADGIQRCFPVFKGNTITSFPFNDATLNVMEISAIEWIPDLSGATIPWYIGMAYLNPPADPAAGAARFYRTNFSYINALITWAQSHYAADVNNTWLYGDCLGTGAYLPAVYNPTLFSMALLLNTSQDIAAWSTTAFNGNFLSTGASFNPGTPSVASLLIDDGVTHITAWADGAALVAAWGTFSDGPAVLFGDSKNDFVLGDSWASQSAFVKAMQAAGQFVAGVWNSYNHSGSMALSIISFTTYSYKKFPRNQALPVPVNFSADDNLGDGTRNASNAYTGDPQGGVNMGWAWTIIKDDATGVTIDVTNSWGNLSPASAALNPSPTTTTGSIPASGGFTVGLTSTTNYVNGDLVQIAGGEICSVQTVAGGNITVAAGGRGQFLSTATAQSSGVAVVRLIDHPTAPNTPSASATADFYIRRIQTFNPAPGTTVFFRTKLGGGSFTAAQTFSWKSALPHFVGAQVTPDGVTATRLDLALS